MSANLETVLIAVKVPNTVLGLSRGNVIVAAMSDNKALFPSPTPPLTQVRADLDALVAAQISATSRAFGTVSARDVLRKVVVADLHQLGAYVLLIASADPEHAQSIAEAASMSVRKRGARHKNDLAVKQTHSAIVQLVAKALKNARAYEWQYSLDGKKTWLGVNPTAQAHVDIGGLQVGVLTWFRFRGVTRTGVTDWSQAVFAVVT